MRTSIRFTDATVQIVIVGTLDLYGRDFADAQRLPGFDVDDAVDLRRITFAAALSRAFCHFVDQDRLAGAYFARQAAAGNLALAAHQPVPSVILDLVGNRSRKFVRGGASDRLIAEAADAVEFGF